MAESLSGLIERVTFHNEENGWAVLKVKAKGHRDLVTLVGSLASVSAGEWVTAEGHWVQDREFGLQFRADMLNSTAVGGKNSVNLILADSQEVVLTNLANCSVQGRRAPRLDFRPFLPVSLLPRRSARQEGQRRQH